MFMRIVQASDSERFLIARGVSWETSYYQDSRYSPYWWSRTFIYNATAYPTMDAALVTFNKLRAKPLKTTYRVVYPSWMQRLSAIFTR